MEAGGGSRHAGPPRTLDVQKFANARGVEVHALHAVLKERSKARADGSEGVVEIPRCLRRRTTSHNRRKAFFWHRKQKKRKLGDEDGDEASGTGRVEAEGGDAVKKPPCRRVRRRIELKGDEEGGGGCSSDGTQRLVTHVWHAKRFTMTKIWGHWLAEGLPGRGLGSRAVMRWAREAAVLHDASFYSAIELEGSGDSISQALQLVSEPAPELSVNQRDQHVNSGVKYGKAMLHHIDRRPRGAIAPVTFMWRPESEAGEERRIWLWVHAAAFEEAFACLQHLCQTQGLQCWSRKGQLGRLDLLGSKAASILQKVLHPVARQASLEGIPPSSSDSSSLIAFLEDSRRFPGGAVIGMEVWDPRRRSHSDTTFQPSVLVDAGSDGMEVEDTEIAVSNSGCASTGAKSPITDTVLQRQQLVGNREIWDRLDTIGQGSIAKPLSEKELSTRRHKERLSYIQLNDTSESTNEELTPASESLKCPVLILKHAHQRTSACGFSLILPIAWVRAFWVPLVFAGGRVVGLRERHWLCTDAQLSSFPHDFPDCFSYDQHMARKAAEDQETYNRRPPSKRGIWKSGRPDWSFTNEASPLYPENRSSAQGVSMAESGTETVCKNSEKTSNDTAVCSSSTGPDAPSAQLNCSTDSRAGISAGISAVTEAEVSITESSKPSNEAFVSPSSGNPTPAEMMPREGGDNGKSPIFVARTMRTLEKVLRDCDLHHLPLLTGFRRFTQLPNGAIVPTWPLHPTQQLVGDGSTELAKKGCLVKVLIHAPRKGVFDSGAIIYLPLPSDVDSYCNSSQRWQGFDDPSFKQVQQSFVNRKKRKQKSGGGRTTMSASDGSTEPPSTDLPEPRCENQDVNSLRVPIGIVTSGSVRGSSSSAAIGICELAALGVLRAKQMAPGDRFPGSQILVLARNASSSMYRPALVVEDSGDLI